MNQLSIEKQELVLKCLLDGTSIRATSRITGVHKNTIIKLFLDAGEAFFMYQDRVLQNLPCRRIEVDEIWSFIYAKNKNVQDASKPPDEAGDIWTWVAICTKTKLIPCWFLGDRSTEAAMIFMADLKPRLTHRIQLTSDSLHSYPEAVQMAFENDIDYAQLVKTFSANNQIDKRKKVIYGNPDPDKISTSYVERSNLTMRMCMRRYTRKTNGFSKKFNNHFCSVALHFMYYNFCRPHMSLKGDTPAMAAGVSDHKWSVMDMVDQIRLERQDVDMNKLNQYSI